MGIEKFSRRNPYDRSVWHATASETPEATPFEDDCCVDVVIIGAGISGATAGVQLQAAGASVAVLDAADAGGGATGRSGGLVVPSFSAIRPGAMLESSGAEGERLLSAVAGSADDLFALVRKYGIECDGAQNGWFHPAHSERALARIVEDAQLWRSVGAEITELDATETTRRTGIPGYKGSIVNDRGGAIHPVKFVHGAIRAMTHLGGRFHPHTRAQTLTRSGGRWIVQTSRGQISGDRLLVCTNARSGGLGNGLERCIIPLNVCQIATEPLSEDARQHLIGQGQSLSDTRTNLFSYRFDTQWRMITGAMPVLPAGDGQLLARRMTARLARFLGLAPVPKPHYVWFGQASVTVDRLPAIYDIGSGAYALVACNGRGLTLSTMLASKMADYLVSSDRSTLPLTIRKAEAVDKRPVQMAGARLYPLYGRIKDAFGV